MFRCTECNEEFEIKPDYCNCGNDEFIEIKTTQTVSLKDNSKRFIEDEEDIKKIKTPVSFSQIFPIAFLCICIILAIIPWTIKTEKPKQTSHKPKKTEINKTIPNIDTFWNDTPVEASKTNNKQQNIEKKPEKVIIPITQKPKNIFKPKPQQKSQAKPQSKPQKPSSNVVVNKPSKPQPQANKPQQNIQKPIKLPPSVLNPSSNHASQATQKPQVIKKPEPPKMNQSEFLNYKGSIRSALLSKLDVVAVQGSGDCAIEFSLDNSGKLINRNFIYKSQNKSVNDQVYLMLMRLPYYKEPPKHYNGEKIKLKFIFNNGYYEITFI